MDLQFQYFLNSQYFKAFISNFMYVFWLKVLKGTTCVQYPKRPEKGIVFPGSGVKDGS